MNQILKERGARNGEVSSATEAESEALKGVTTRGESKETTGAVAAAKPCETAGVEDWSMALQSGLEGLLLWQQSILPDMDFMVQVGEAFSIAPWQIPQGVRATKTPRINVIRLKN